MLLSTAVQGTSSVGFPIEQTFFTANTGKKEKEKEVYTSLLWLLQMWDIPVHLRRRHGRISDDR